MTSGLASQMVTLRDTGFLNKMAKTSSYLMANQAMLFGAKLDMLPLPKALGHCQLSLDDHIGRLQLVRNWEMFAT